MRGVKESRHPPVVALIGLLVCAPLFLWAQAGIQEVDDVTPAQKSTPQLDSTPEEIGDAYLAQRRYQEAIEYYNRAPRSAAVWNKTGIAFELMLNFKDAENCYKQSLRLQARDAQVSNNLATVYDSMKKYRKAEHLYRKALKIAPNSPRILKNLGTNLMVRHKYQKGWDAYSKALALDPHIFDSPGMSTVENAASLHERGAMNYYMAKSCVKAGLPERAVQFLRQALSEGFTSPRKLAEDESFAPLRKNPAFQALVAEHPSP
ncbi:MAG TPA: tetratricopeptide repeat protein [Bryobacteraceae bacterium]|nr:tetratricopeptide repeat protein [Bryobacteraceae bacterium]